MRIEHAISDPGRPGEGAGPSRALVLYQAPPAPAASGRADEAYRPPSPLAAIIGDVDVRHATPRRMVDLGLDLHVAGYLDWEEYRMLAFQPELQPDYDRTIGVLTGEPARPDRARDFVAEWEERVAFELRHNADRPRRIRHAEHIAGVLRHIDNPADITV